MSAQGGITFEVVTTIERFDAVRGAWHALWRASGLPVFQSPDWVRAWWTTLPATPRRTLLLVLAWQGEALVGVMPLATKRFYFLRVLEWAAQDCADYCDVLLAPGQSPALTLSLWQAARRHGGFDVARLGHLKPEATAQILLREARVARMRLDPRREAAFRICGPFDNGAQWLAQHPKKVRQNYKRGLAQLQALGEVRLRVVNEAAEQAAVLAQLAVFKRQTLERRGLSAPMFDTQSRALDALVAVLRAEGQLRLFVLEVAGQPAAISVNFEDAGTLSAFVTAYDPALDKASPGYVLIFEYIQWAFDRGLTVVDFLRGAEDFKRRFASAPVPLATLAAPATPLGWLMLNANALRKRRAEVQTRARALLHSVLRRKLIDAQS